DDVPAPVDDVLLVEASATASSDSAADTGSAVSRDSVTPVSRNRLRPISVLSTGENCTRWLQRWLCGGSLYTKWRGTFSAPSGGAVGRTLASPCRKSASPRVALAIAVGSKACASDLSSTRRNTPSK